MGTLATRRNHQDATGQFLKFVLNHSPPVVEDVEFDGVLHRLLRPRSSASTCFTASCCSDGSLTVIQPHCRGHRSFRNWSIYQDKSPRWIGPRVPNTSQWSQRRSGAGSQNSEKGAKRGQRRALSSVTRYDKCSRLAADCHSLPGPLRNKLEHSRDVPQSDCKSSGSQTHDWKEY